MTPTEYRRARLKMGLTQAELGARLGVHALTVARREWGTRPVCREAELALGQVAALVKGAQGKSKGSLGEA